MKKWMERKNGFDFSIIARELGVSEVTACLLYHRGLRSGEAVREYLYPTAEQLHSPFLMNDMQKACDTIWTTIQSKQKIRIIGDYDVDGIVATYLLYDGLQRLGAIVDYRIPERVRDGYGINEMMVRSAANDGIALLLTCDNGISAAGVTELAYELRMKVVITDHHAIPERLPRAEAILNPRLDDSTYPYTELCGAAVACKLMEALNGEQAGEVQRRYSDLVAAATVCDVMPLTGENRCLVKLGLEKLHTDANLGLQALIRGNQCKADEIGSYHLGFILGPCINASGRLDTAELGLQLLLETEDKTADRLSEQLISLNQERKVMTQEAVEEADKLISEMKKLDNVLVLLLKHCHESIAGIVAGRIREKYYRPTFILTYGQDCIKGSGRSVEGYHMAEALQKCADLMEHFGGHPMAAGLSMKEECIDELRRKLNRECTLTKDELIKKVTIDMRLPFYMVTNDLVQELKLLEPFGNGNPSPVFAGSEFEVTSAQYFGKIKHYIRFRLRDTEGTEMDALYFGDSEEMDRVLNDTFGMEETNRMYQKKPNKVRFSAIFDIDSKEYMGVKSLQLIIRDYKVSSNISKQTPS